MKSMTGYGTAEGTVGKGRLFVEVKSINHRFSEVIVKIPNKMGAIEGVIRKWIQDCFTRGKIEVFMKEREPLFGGNALTVDVGLAKGYEAAFRKLIKGLCFKADQDFLQYVSVDRFISAVEREGSYERLWPAIARLLRKAAQDVDRMRVREGRHLANDQRKRLRLLQMTAKKIQRQSERAVGQHLERLKRRLSTGNATLDEERLQAEASLLGGRQDVTEELTRLLSHAHQYWELMRSGDAVGRKLDFLIQEMNREINTIGAKAADVGISRLVVDGKAELERLREQVQNIE